MLVCKILTWKCFPWTFLLYLCDFFCAQSGWSSSWRPNNHLLKIKDHYLLEHLKMAKFSRETKTFVVFLFSSPCRRTRRCRCVLWRSGPFAFGGRRSRRVGLSEPTPENIVKTNLSHLPKVHCHRDLKVAKKKLRENQILGSGPRRWESFPVNLFNTLTLLNGFEKGNKSPIIKAAKDTDTNAKHQHQNFHRNRTWHCHYQWAHQLWDPKDFLITIPPSSSS